MSKLFNLVIGLLIILFFIAVGWTFLKSSSFINEQAAKAKAGAQTVTENTSTIGQNIKKFPEKARELIKGEHPETESKSLDKQQSAHKEASDKTVETTTKEAEQKAAEEKAKSLAAEKKEITEKASKNIPQEYEAAGTQRLKASPANTTKAPYMVITGSFTKTINAEIELKKLRSLGYTDAKSVHLGTTKYLSVIAGHYNTQKEAEAASSQLKKQGIKAAYVHKRKERK